MWDRVELWIPGLSDIQMAESCLIVEWCVIWMASEDLTGILRVKPIKWLLAFR